MLSIIQTSDGSFSAYNSHYADYYHDRSGALLESICKHIIPAFGIKNKPHIRILDICFGLGYNALLSIIYAKRANIRLSVHSIEIDLGLLQGLRHFPYPRIISSHLDMDRIIDCIDDDRIFVDSTTTLSVFRGDAVHFIDTLDSGFFDIIYQDAFSPSKNQALWSEHHFSSLYRILGDDGIVTTYSSSRKVRDVARFCGFDVFDMRFGGLKNGTLLSKGKNCIRDLGLVRFSKIDF